MSGYQKMPKGHSKKVKWTDFELDSLYRLAIINGHSVEELSASSAKDRTKESIRSKLNKTFGVSLRLRDNGQHYLYLSSEVPKRIRTRRVKAMNVKFEQVSEPTETESSQGNTMTYLELLEAKLACYDRIKNMELMIQTERQLIECYEEIQNSQGGHDEV